MYKNILYTTVYFSSNFFFFFFTGLNNAEAVPRVDQSTPDENTPFQSTNPPKEATRPTPMKKLTYLET